MAERMGFEPMVRLLGVHTISSRAPSASSDTSPRFLELPQMSGGERGIRTPGAVIHRTTDFESAAFDLSAISPRKACSVLTWRILQ